MEPLPTDDRAPAPPQRRLVPPGLLVAAVLATAVVAIAVLVAVRSGGGSSVPDQDADPAAAGSPFTIRSGLNAPSNDPVGKPLPDLGYTTFDGAPASLSSYRGRPLVINFWSSTCTPCTTEMPEFQRVHEQQGDKVAFLGLDVQDSVQNGQFMLEKTGVKYDVGRDPTGDVMIKLGGIVLPTTVLVAADGTVRKVHSGQMSADELTASIQELSP